jgi:outer membrane protein assembly complex protein YaeT
MGLRCNRGAALRNIIRAAALCIVSATALHSQSASLEGERVVEIRVVEENGRPVEGYLPKFQLQEGQPFELEAERHSLRALYRSGDFADIRVEAIPVAGGIRVDFVVRRNFYYNTVRVEGIREPPSEGQALSALRLGLGEPFRESAVRDALNRLADVLHEEGLYQAKLDYKLAPKSETRQMDVTVQVTPGPRARIGAIQMQNQSEFPDQELLHRSKLFTGKDVTRSRLERGAERTRKFLVSKDHLGARAVIRRGEYDPKTNMLPLVFEITAGPKVHVEIQGAKISGKQLHKLLPIYAEGAVDEDLLQEGRRNLRDEFQREGYFDVQVQYSTREDKDRGEEVITYNIDRGSRHRLVGVGFVGNQYFGSELLESRLSIQTAAFASRGRFSEQLLRSDVDSIRDLYLANGFREAQVQSEVDDNYGRKPGDIFVRFHITEGPQTLVAELKLEGNHALSDAELLAVTGSTPGEPYSEFDVTSDRDNILALYYNEGFPEASFNSQVAETGVPNRVRLTYGITEGLQIEVAKVLVSGYQHTRLGIIERQVQVKAGGPLREGDVVETQRRLYNLGIFNRVQVAPQNPDGADPDKDVVVEVDEAKRYTIGYGGGFEVQRLGGAGVNPVGTTLSASPRGIFEISKANFGGRAQTVSFKVRASTLQYRALLSFSAPNFLNKPKFNVLLTGFADKTRDVRTFTSTRYEASAQLAQSLTPFSSVIYRYTFRHVLAGDLKIAPEEIPLFSQPTWLRDHRDNPADASRGSFNSADSSVAARSLGSSDSFSRFFFQNSTFHPIKRSFVFARSVRFGVEKPLAGTTSQQIPLPERFFAGGGTSLRGFSLNQAGPRDPVTGFPIGGRAELIFNQEIRFPMRLPYVGSRLGGAVFYDAGNVFSDVGHITLRTSPSAFSTRTGDLNYFSHTIGYSFRYSTPIGPVRLDLGYQLNPARFMFTSSNPGCATPSPPSSCQQTAQLPHFQFFFNIGAIF